MPMSMYKDSVHGVLGSKAVRTPVKACWRCVGLLRNFVRDSTWEAALDNSRGFSNWSANTAFLMSMMSPKPGTISPKRALASSPENPRLTMPLKVVPPSAVPRCCSGMPLDWVLARAMSCGVRVKAADTRSPICLLKLPYRMGATWLSNMRCP